MNITYVLTYTRSGPSGRLETFNRERRTLAECKSLEERLRSLFTKNGFSFTSAIFEKKTVTTYKEI